jgi:hypothetical protein
MIRLAFLPVLLVKVVVSLSCFVAGASAQHELEPRTKLVDGPMMKLAPMLGTWEIESQWANGTPLWAKNEYFVGLGGRFVEAKTYSKNPAGKIYQRYHTIFGYDEAKQEYMSWGFTYDGTEKTLPVQVEESDGRVSLTSEWEQAPGSRIKQTVTIGADAGQYQWTVWSKEDDGDWTEIMDGTWKRVE